METVKIAEVCHEVNKAYCEGIGDLSQLPWAEAPEAIKASAVKGVEHALANPDATPEGMHIAWCQHKIKEGWTFGVDKDMEKKTHPCLMPYAQLPALQRAKDRLFLAVVKSLRG